MFSLNESMRYWLYSVRKSFHTLSGLVRDRMGCNPLDGDVYIFINRHRNRMKLLHREGWRFTPRCWSAAHSADRPDCRKIGKYKKQGWNISDLLA